MVGVLDFVIRTSRETDYVLERAVGGRVGILVACVGLVVGGVLLYAGGLLRRVARRACFLARLPIREHQAMPRLRRLGIVCMLSVLPVFRLVRGVGQVSREPVAELVLLSTVFVVGALVYVVGEIGDSVFDLTGKT
ncbi:MAG: hypothetical protein IPJ34_06015 [Myxococcales bacterium]|nr:hypothetical protein [Myxococcales bacterium]